jgi:hypothetical protein
VKPMNLPAVQRTIDAEHAAGDPDEVECLRAELAAVRRELEAVRDERDREIDRHEGTAIALARAQDAIRLLRGGANGNQR